MVIANPLDCRSWYVTDELLAYHDREWGLPVHDDQRLFEMLCLEGASVGLSWRTILHKRPAYRRLFHDFDIDACASMSDVELELALADPGIVRSRAKVYAVRGNARAAQAIRREFGSLDAYLWGFVSGRQVVGAWVAMDEIPTQTDLSRTVSTDLKRRGMSFVGPVITYSFLQAVGIINDHLLSCDRREACLQSNAPTA
ncbi:MAG: DNA-3-methyladenine glycosylase I [Atopobiaceae bacterium]|nr:DNA-3-methyladenine glycosylase I [Atopobiaceae bacterium]